MKYIAFTFIFVALSLCSCKNNKVNDTQSSEMQTGDTLRTITEEMAFEGVNNYCHREYDWSVAKDNPDIMYVQMGEETDSAYQVIFRSYTGAFVHFYVNKTSGATRMVERVPNLNVKVRQFEEVMAPSVCEQWKATPHYIPFEPNTTMISICHNCTDHLSASVVNSVISLYINKVLFQKHE